MRGGDPDNAVDHYSLKKIGDKHIILRNGNQGDGDELEDGKG